LFPNHSYYFAIFLLNKLSNSYQVTVTIIQLCQKYNDNHVNISEMAIMNTSQLMITNASNKEHLSLIEILKMVVIVNTK